MLFPSMRLKWAGRFWPRVTSPMPFSTVIWCVMVCSSSTYAIMDSGGGRCWRFVGGWISIAAYRNMRLISPRHSSMVFPVNMPMSMNPRALMVSFRGSPVSKVCLPAHCFFWCLDFFEYVFYYASWCDFVFEGVF